MYIPSPCPTPPEVSSLDGLTWKDFSAGLDAWRAQRRRNRDVDKLLTGTMNDGNWTGVSQNAEIVGERLYFIQITGLI